MLSNYVLLIIMFCSICSVFLLWKVVKTLTVFIYVLCDTVAKLGTENPKSDEEIRYEWMKELDKALSKENE